MMSMIPLIVYALGFIVAYCWLTILRGKGEPFGDDENILIPPLLWPLMLLVILVHEIEERREKRKEE